MDDYRHNPTSLRITRSTSLWCIVIVSLLVRGILAWKQPALLTDDADGYLAHAQLVAEHQGFVGPYTLRPTAFRPPAYPLLLAIALAAKLPAAMAVLLIHFVSTALCVVMTARLADQLCFSRSAILGSALLIALDPLLLRYSIQPMTELPCAALLISALVLYITSLSPCDSGCSWYAASGAGLLLAIGALIRPTLLVVAVLLTLHRVLRQPVPLLSSKITWHHRLRPAAVFAVAFACGLSPWIVRNAFQFHAFIPATTHGGYTLALGNNPDFYRDVIRGSDTFPWDGKALDQWQQASLRQARLAGVDVASETAMDAWYYTLGIQAIRQSPGSFLQACGLRLQRFWSVSTAEHNSRMQNTLLSVWYGALWTGVLVAACLQLKRRNIGLCAPLWLCIAAFCLMHTVYWTDTRMRTPVMPVMIPLSVQGWSMIWGAIRTGQRKT